MKSSTTAKTPLHLRLTTEDWVECFKDLTRAELGVLYYIRTLDPYGDRNLEIDCTLVGKLLGIHRTSVSRSLEDLKKKGFIDMEIEKAKVRQKINNRKLTLLTSHKNESNNEEIEDLKTCAPTHSNERPRTTECADAQPCASTHNNEHPRTGMSLQPLPDKDSSISHTIQTYKDFKKTLSKEERENFEKFVREEYFRREGKKIRTFSAFMQPAEFFQEWHRDYQNRPEALEATQNAKWESHPHRDEWLRKICTMGNFSFRTEGGKLDKERHEFWNWAVDNGLLREDLEQ